MLAKACPGYSCRTLLATLDLHEDCQQAALAVGVSTFNPGLVKTDKTV